MMGIAVTAFSGRSVLLVRIKTLLSSKILVSMLRTLRSRVTLIRWGLWSVLSMEMLGRRIRILKSRIVIIDLRSMRLAIRVES